jgi:hypothetical protein
VKAEWREVETGWMDIDVGVRQAEWVVIHCVR